MRIAFSSLACPESTVEQIADAARRYRYAGIEWRLADGALLSPRTPDDVWERIASCGVDAVCLDTSAVFVQADDDGRAKAVRHTVSMGSHAERIGAPCLRVFGGPIPDGHSRDALIGPTRDALAEAASKTPAGIDVLVETHDAWSRGVDVAQLGVGVVWDIAHTLRSGESPKETLGNIGVPGLVHIKDAVGEKLTHLGEGKLPLEDAIGALVGTGYDGWLSFEWEKLWHPDLDDANLALPKARAFLQELSL